MKGQWVGDNEIWSFEGNVRIEGSNVRGRIWWTFVKCDKPSTKSASWLKRIGDSSYEDVEGSLDIEDFKLKIRGCRVGDSTLLALGVDSIIDFSRDWKEFQGTTCSSSQTSLRGTLSGSADVEFE